MGYFVCVCTCPGVPGLTGWSPDGHEWIYRESRKKSTRGDVNIISIIGISYPRRSGKCGGAVATSIGTNCNFYTREYL